MGAGRPRGRRPAGRPGRPDGGEVQGLRISAEQVFDLATVRKRYAKALRLACNGGADAERLAELLDNAARRLDACEAGSLARAAERLGVSTVSVHRALHSLETGTRCSLFRLEGRNLLPTDAALALADVAAEVLHAMSEGIRSTREIAGYAADRIRIGESEVMIAGGVESMSTAPATSAKVT